jgi:hypothetical protein
VTVAASLAASTAGNFQAAWYYTIIAVFGLAFISWGVYQVARTLRSMLRDGDVLLFAACLSVVAIVVLFFVSLLAMTLVRLGPPVGGS